MSKTLPVERVVKGLALAAVTPPALLVLAFLLWETIFNFGSGIIPLAGFAALVIFSGTLVAGMHALVLGLPLFQLLMCWGWPRWWMAAAGGFLVGAVPLTLVTASLNIVELALGGLGMAGGLAFWTAVRTPLAEREEAELWPRIFASE